MRGILSLADAVFGLPVVEWLECGGCGRITQRRELLMYHLVAQVGRRGLVAPQGNVGLPGGLARKVGGKA